MHTDLEQALADHFRALGLSPQDAIDRAHHTLNPSPPACAHSIEPEGLADVWRGRARLGTRSLVLQIEPDGEDLASWTGRLNVPVLHETCWPHARGAEPSGSRPSASAATPADSH